MKLTARVAVVVYALAIVLASVAPHCVWMFSPIEVAAASAHAAPHAMGHADTHQHPQQGECASMTMAKSIGPVPVAFAIVPPSDMGVLVFATTVVQPTLFRPAEARQPRGPPPLAYGFARIFASNHRLLI